jgi:hypothetical protein
MQSDQSNDLNDFASLFIHFFMCAQYVYCSLRAQQQTKKLPPRIVSLRWLLLWVALGCCCSSQLLVGAHKRSQANATAGVAE